MLHKSYGLLGVTSNARCDILLIRCLAFEEDPVMSVLDFRCFSFGLHNVGHLELLYRKFGRSLILLIPDRHGKPSNYFPVVTGIQKHATDLLWGQTRRVQNPLFQNP